MSDSCFGINTARKSIIYNINILAKLCVAFLIWSSLCESLTTSRNGENLLTRGETKLITDVLKFLFLWAEEMWALKFCNYQDIDTTVFEPALCPHFWGWILLKFCGMQIANSQNPAPGFNLYVEQVIPHTAVLTQQ